MNDDTSDKQLVNYGTKETDANVTFLDEFDENRIVIYDIQIIKTTVICISVQFQYQKMKVSDWKWEQIE